MQNINRIFLFGDSWVEGQGIFDSIENRPNGKIHLLENGLHGVELSNWRKENSWNKFLKKYVNCEIVNLAKQGSSNYMQFSELNSVLLNLNKTDLVLFGFTSKYRDTIRQIEYAYTQGFELLSSTNPLRNLIAYEKQKVNSVQGFSETNSNYKSDFEKTFTENFIQDFFVQIFDENLYENIAQNNYLFYQNWFKSKQLNVLFFDLFESYVNPKFVNKWFDVDETMYITYKKDSMHQTLLKYELETYTKDSPHTIWEYADVKFPPMTEIYHPNQYGYEYYVDWLWKTYLSKQYKFNDR